MKNHVKSENPETQAQKETWDLIKNLRNASPDQHLPTQQRGSGIRVDYSWRSSKTLSLSEEKYLGKSTNNKKEILKEEFEASGT